MESKDTSAQSKAVVDIIKNCTFGKINDVSRKVTYF